MEELKGLLYNLYLIFKMYLTMFFEWITASTGLGTYETILGIMGALAIIPRLPKIIHKLTRFISKAVDRFGD